MGYGKPEQGVLPKKRIGQPDRFRLHFMEKQESDYAYGKTDYHARIRAGPGCLFPIESPDQSWEKSGCTNPKPECRGLSDHTTRQDIGQNHGGNHPDHRAEPRQTDLATPYAPCFQDVFAEGGGLDMN